MRSEGHCSWSVCVSIEISPLERLFVLKTIYKVKKNIIKMLKDVGMTVPKSRETRAVYMQQNRG